MNNLVRFPNRRQVREEACSWLVSIDEGLTAEERNKFTEWLAADPSHLEVLTKMAAHWDAQSLLSELSALFPVDQGARRRLRWSLPKSAAVAAITLIAIGIGWYTISGADKTTSNTISVTLPPTPLDSNRYSSAAYSGEARSYETAVGEQLSVRLSDGSVATLNTDTAINVRYSTEERLVLLRRGEASFTVSRDAQRPFSVRAGQRKIQAIGTAFNVQLGLDDNIELTVSEGRVRVTSVLESLAATLPNTDAPDAEEPDVTLSAGEMAVIDQGGTAVRAVDQSEIEAKLSWQQGFLVFRGDPLHAVIEDVSRYTTITLMIDDSIRDVRVGGYFRAGDIDGLLVALDESFGIEPRRVSDDLVVLSAR